MIRPLAVFTGFFVLFLVLTYATDSADYLMYERAANRLLSGDLANLYEPNAPYPPKFHYSYFFALCFVPFALVGSLFGQLIYFTGFAICVVLLLKWSLELTKAFSPPLTEKEEYAAQVLAVFPLLFPAARSFDEGNIGILLATLLFASYRWQDRRPVAAGALLGVAITFKIYPALLLGYFAWSHRWKVVGAALAFTALFYLVLPSIILGPSEAVSLVARQFQALGDFGHHWPMGHIEHQNITGWLLRWRPMGLSEATLYRTGLALGLMIPVAVLLPSFRQTKSKALEFQAMAFVFALVPVIVPTSWTDMGIFFAPAVCLVAYNAVTSTDRLCQIGFGIFWVGMLLCNRALWGYGFVNQMREYSMQLVASVGLILALLSVAHPRRSKATAS